MAVQPAAVAGSALAEGDEPSGRLPLMISHLKQSNLTVAQKGAILVLVPLFSVVFLAVLNFLLDQAEYDREREAHSRAVISVISNLRRSLIDAVSTLTQYGIAREPVFEERYNSIVAEFPRLFNEGRQLVQNNQQQAKLLDHLQLLQSTASRIMEQSKQAIESGESNASLLNMVGLRKQLNSLIKQYNLELNQLEELERNSQTPHHSAILWRMRVKQVLLAGIVINIIASLLLAKFFSFGITRRLATLRDNAARLARGQVLLPPIDGKDEIAEVDGVFHHMANILEATEKKERAIIEKAADIICSIDASLRFTAVSPAAHAIWGYTPDELIGRRFIDLVVAEDAKATLDATTVLMERKAPFAFENRVKRKDGLRASMLWSAFWSELEGCLFCIVHDITERQEVELLKSELVAMASHDLRSPLCSLKGVLDMLQTGVYGSLSATGLSRLFYASQEVDRLVELIDDLLDIKKIEAGKLALDLSCVQLNSVVTRSVRAVSRLAEQNGITIAAGKTTVQVYADGARLIQVLVNLLSNAIKFSPKGSIITVLVHNHSQWVEVQVADQGRGIPASHKQRIFEHFEQVNQPDAIERNGAGLGLAICKTIIEKHRGIIGVDSEEGKGSRFYFRIPVIETPE